MREGVETGQGRAGQGVYVCLGRALTWCLSNSSSIILGAFL